MLLIALSWLALAAAPDSPLDQGARAVEELRADDAVRLLEVARHAGPWTYADHVRLYEQLGLAYAYQGKADDARAAFERLLTIDPGHAIPYTLSPKVTFLFQQAREQLRTRPPPTLDIAFPRDAQAKDPLPLTFEVLVDPLSFLRHVELHFRLKGQPGYRLLQTALAAPGHYVQLALPPEALERDFVREFFAVVKDDQGNEVLRVGSERFPREAAARFLPVMKWYQRWWVWALVGSTVALGAGLGVFGATRPLPDTIPLTVTTTL